MNKLKSYSTRDVTYILSRVDPSQVEEHCHQYMDSIAGVLFHGSETQDLIDNMHAAINRGIALILSDGTTDLAYLYMVPVGKIRHNVIVLHFLTDTPVTRAIIEHEMYSIGSILRYTPKDPTVEHHTHLLAPVSTRMFRESRTSTINMLPNVPTEANLTNLNIKVV